MSEHGAHETDLGGERNLVKEAEVIKKKVEEQMKPEVKVSAIQFTSLAESKIPGFSLTKILGNRLDVEYVPDTYYVIDLAQRMFLRAKQDKALKRVEEVNIYSFTLYISYALMYTILATLNEVNPIIGIDLIDVLTIFRTAGFGTIKLPAFMSQWISGLGLYRDPDTGRRFLPFLPPPDEEGVPFDGSFYQQHVSHLLPHFRGLFALVILNETGNTVPMANNMRTRNMFLGNDYAGTAVLNGTQISRRNAFRIPGMQHVQYRIADPVLVTELNRVLALPQSADPLRRYLLLDRHLLTHLNHAIQPYFEHLDYITLSNVSTIGTSMSMISLVHQDEQEEIIPGKNIPAEGDTQQCIFQSRPSYSARVLSRTQVINGDADYVSQTPIVRISNTDTAVEFPDQQFVDPQPAWYQNENEFRSQSFTLDEAHAYFQKK